MADTEISVKTKDDEKPVKVTRHIRKSDRLPWQRMTLSCIGLLIIVGIWQWATWHLYSLPEHAITAFNSITNNSFYVIGAIVVFMVTGKLVYDWKNQTVSEVIEHAEHITERRDSHEVIEQKIDETVRNENLREHLE